MEYLIGGAVFAVYLAAQLLAVIATRAPATERVRETATAAVATPLPINRQAWT